MLIRSIGTAVKRRVSRPAFQIATLSVAKGMPYPISLKLCKRFMDPMVLPKIENGFASERIVDELPHIARLCRNTVYQIESSEVACRPAMRVPSTALMVMKVRSSALPT